MRVNVSLALFPLVTTAQEVEKESRSVSMQDIGHNYCMFFIIIHYSTIFTEKASESCEID